LKTACDKGIAQGFQTGVTSVVMAAGFNISKIWHYEMNFGAYTGPINSEIEQLLDNISGN